MPVSKSLMRSTRVSESKATRPASGSAFVDTSCACAPSFDTADSTPATVGERSSVRTITRGLTLLVLAGVVPPDHAFTVDLLDGRVPPATGRVMRRDVTEKLGLA